MAVGSTKIDTDLVIVVNVGVDEDGNEILKNKRFSKIKTNAADQDVYDVAIAIGNLLDGTLSDVKRVDSNMLAAE